MEEKEVNFGIGFVTGRENVCKIINSYYKDMLEQVSRYKCRVKITIFILFDTSYQQTKREGFYNLQPEVYKDINIKYITPEDIKEEIKKLVIRKNMNKEDMEFFLGHGHARGRNTIMYYAIKHQMNYLLFWDDDEYPEAVFKQNKEIQWARQENILKHLEFMDKEQADVTIGHHCGYISPIPYIDFNENFTEQDMKEFIEIISNDIISWESIREKMNKNNGVTYADFQLVQTNRTYEIQTDGIGKWIAGSTLCLNLNKCDKIPAFYNPPLARGEDTFFSTLLGESKIIRIPIYHFHDGFLKYTEIMEGVYPKHLRKINVKEHSIKERFLKATLGWIKYKPLLLYVINKEKYPEEMKQMKEKLQIIVPKLNEIFKDDCFSELIKVTEIYDKKVKEHYEEYKRTNQIWNLLKERINHTFIK